MISKNCKVFAIALLDPWLQCLLHILSSSFIIYIIYHSTNYLIRKRLFDTLGNVGYIGDDVHYSTGNYGFNGGNNDNGSNNVSDGRNEKLGYPEEGGHKIKKVEHNVVKGDNDVEADYHDISNFCVCKLTEDSSPGSFLCLYEQKDVSRSGTFYKYRQFFKPQNRVSVLRDDQLYVEGAVLRFPELKSSLPSFPSSSSSSPSPKSSAPKLPPSKVSTSKQPAIVQMTCFVYPRGK
ncbi:hypothetical protein HELRODRAFT_172561 [Helobdella robusta]|uniref:Uncharacterized protein n=1 Tax=Helobdella robusta TaxID=6412 RepID=T1F5I6_HELRO|nr:hypothetical protein HELRODRAFT_172561 [Helobdella robusta]ESO04211.1 hypothetical protein HELRODRAFT_172561 [Helobdella robusta]